MKERYQEAIPCLTQISDGLELYGLLDLIRANEGLFHVVFCPNDELT